MAKTNQRTFGICLLLGLVTLACYWPVTRHGFVNIDDHQYIYENDHVKSGLSWGNIVWAFTTGYASNWHPLTWISHMADCQMFGLDPGPPHLVSLLFHIADSLLLFLWLRQMTGAVWRGAFVAAFFAWHPLHVESVAWASERKDVLSTLFWLLTLMAYVRYAQTSNIQSPTSKICYRLSLLFFVLGLMSKPMVVTLPCVLLLLDFWPLGRVRLTGLNFAGDGSRRRKEAEGPDRLVTSSATPEARESITFLLCEKLPFFALTILASVVTCLVQQNATTSLEVLPLKTRMANAAVAYLTYLSKTFWPVNFAAMYPYSKHLPPWLVLGALLVLTGVTAISLREAWRRPCLITGWLWFLGTLVPTIGLVQVGSQAMADRYMYIPSIGLFIAVIWLLADWARPSRAGRNVLVGLGVAALGCCLALTSRQLQTWKNGETLFRHAIEATRDNSIAYDSLAGALDMEGRHDEALNYYYESVRIEPKYPEAQYNLGTMLKNLGRLDEAAEHLRAAIAANPKFAAAYVNLGSVLMKQGKIADAGGQFIEALKLNRSDPEAFFNMGTWLLAEGRLEDAVTAFNEAIQLKPDYEDAHGNLGVTLMRLGRAADGTAHLDEAVRLSPTNSQAHFNLGLAYLNQDRPDEAVTQFNDSLALKPQQALVYSKLALAREKLHQTADAIFSDQEALRLQPDNLEALNGLAWLLATDPDPKIRSGAEALELAKRACGLTEFKRPDMMETLAAAYAEAGRFPEAVTTMQKAIDLATAGGLDDLVTKGNEMLKEFQAGQPYRSSP
jgi:protein O-mannosyl-transferase